jgi:hypothetical protein
MWVVFFLFFLFWEGGRPLEVVVFICIFSPVELNSVCSLAGWCVIFRMMSSGSSASSSSSLQLEFGGLRPAHFLFGKLF